MDDAPVTAQERVSLFSCIESFSRVGLAVSGGADSCALLHLASEWAGSRGEKAPKLVVLTVDHGLRQDSAREVEWVRDRAAAYGLECAMLHRDPGEVETSIQERARELRYGLMTDYAHEKGLETLVTAHHLDDQAETFLMRLARGSGLDGLAAIPERGEWAGIPVVRPLLDIPKTRLVATLQASGKDWLEDPSNEDDRFERVRFRNALETLAEQGVSAEAIARSARRLRRARSALVQVTGEFLGRHAVLDPAGFCQLDLDALRNAPAEIAVRALERSLQVVGGRFEPASLSTIESLVEALENGSFKGKTCAGCHVQLNDGRLLICREAGRMDGTSLSLEPGQTCIWDNRYRVSLSSECTTPVEVRALGSEAYGKVRVQMRTPVNLPERVPEGLVSFWSDGEVLCVPPLGFASSGVSAENFNAELIHTGL